jgi:hypothetical protein
MTNGLIKPSERFRQEIQPALDDYLKELGSERLANNLARAIDHQVDWTFEYYEQTDPRRLNGAKDEKSFRRQLLGQCPELAIMNDLSDAAHHRFLNRPSNPARVTVTSSAAYSVQAIPHSRAVCNCTFQLAKRRSCQPQRRQSTFGVIGKIDRLATVPRRTLSKPSSSAPATPKKSSVLDDHLKHW